MIDICGKCFPDIDQSILNNPESGCGKNCSLKEVSSQDLRLNTEDTNEFQLVQGLLVMLFDSYGPRIPDCCKNCNKVGFCTTSSSISSIAKMLIVQLVISGYDPLINKSRKLIPNLQVDDTVTFEKLNIYGIIWHQGANASSGHYVCMFNVNDKMFFFCK